ncbi:MAG: carboxypeptidase regulatory-like domain-containing protein, partial [Acidobacteriota bacterium]|nr:carboxypeptidase regulatory-like domain-containing protein [Acidobacteriota bacterium]
RPTYMMQWNLSYQRQLGKDWLVSVNYLGNKTTHIWGAYDINPAIYIPGSSASTNQRRPLYLQNPAQGQFYSGINQADDGGSSHYNGVLSSVQHRFANSFTLLANYTWSHCISDIDFQGELAAPLYQNQNNRAGERGSCIFDHRSIFNSSAVAVFPAFQNALLSRIASGWQIAPIFTAASGAPITLTDGGRDISMTGALQDRPNVISTKVYPDKQTVNQWINTAAFAVQPTGAFGNLGRTSLVGPGSWNVDVSLSRTFKPTERLGVELRADSFNILNHPNWNAPAVSIASSTFGQITSFSSPRIIQLATKLRW